MEQTLEALHGFLGETSDWSLLKRLSCPVEMDSLFQREAILPFWKWAEKFNQKTSLKQPSHKIILGYSMGGRLALHALLNRPHLWKGAIIISAHPGLTTPDERRQRLFWDKQLSQRFLHEPWDKLMQFWNSQPLFEEENSMHTRCEDHFDRKLLAEALDAWSLGRQEDLRMEICHLNMPILWMVGERDIRYLELAKTVSFHHPLSKLFVVPNAGHRLAWHQSDLFIKTVNQFINQVKVFDDKLPNISLDPNCHLQGY